MAECIFCDIVNNSGKAARVHETESVLAFMDLVPINPGHTLVIPKDHYAQLSDVPPEIGAEMMRVAMQIEQALRAGDLQTDGTNLLLSSGRPAGQEIFHVHLHVIPRQTGDGSGFRFNSVNRAQKSQDVLQQHAGMIKAKLS